MQVYRGMDIGTVKLLLRRSSSSHGGCANISSICQMFQTAARKAHKAVKPVKHLYSVSEPAFILIRLSTRWSFPQAQSESPVRTRYEKLAERAWCENLHEFLITKMQQVQDLSIK